jgi:Ca2+-transporting ATPase
VLFYGALITAVTLGAFVWALGQDEAHATTISFMTLALAQIFHLGNARSREAVLDWRHAVANPYALGALVISVGLQLVAMYVAPLAAVLRVVPLDARDWAVVGGLAVLPAVVGQILRLRAPGGPSERLPVRPSS